MAEFREEKVGAGDQNGVGRSKETGNREETILRGSKIPRGDGVSQEITVGGSPFIAIDFGDAIRASKKICQDAQNIDNLAPNQCLLLHLVAGVQWMRTKKQQGIP